MPRHGSGYDFGLFGELTYRLFRRSPAWLGFVLPVAIFLIPLAVADAILRPSVSLWALWAVPVVATRVGGLPDVVRDGEDGFLVPAGATDELAERLARLARDPELRERMGRSGREHVHGRYAVERLVDDVDLLYRSLLESTS